MLELKIKFFRKDWSIKGQGIIFRSSLNVLVKKNKLAKIVFSILVLVVVILITSIRVLLLWSEKNLFISKTW